MRRAGRHDRRAAGSRPPEDGDQLGCGTVEVGDADDPFGAAAGLGQAAGPRSNLSTPAGESSLEHRDQSVEQIGTDVAHWDQRDRSLSHRRGWHADC